MKIIKLKPFCLKFDAALRKVGLNTSVSCSILRAGKMGAGRKMPAKFMDKRDCWALSVFPLKAERASLSF